MARILTADTAYADVYVDGDALWDEFGSEIWPDPTKTKMSIDENMRDRIISRLSRDHNIDTQEFDALCGRDLSPSEEAEKREVLHDLVDALEEVGVISIKPGGSAMNTCSTVARALPGAHVTMLTSVGHGPLGKKLREKMGNAMEFQPDSQSLRTSMSFVFSHHDGSRHYAKFSGTTEKVNEQSTVEARQRPYDAVFLSSSILAKEKMPELFVPMQAKALREGTELYFTLPTDAKIANEHHEAVENAIMNADVVMANDEEMQYMFDPEGPKDDLDSYNHCLKTLRGMMKPGASAFITHGGHGAEVITDNKIHHIPLWDDTDKPFVDFGGAGDASYAGFLTGFMAGHDPITSGHIGMAFARDCISRKQAQIEHPDRVYAEALAHERVGLPGIDARFETLQPAVEKAVESQRTG